MPLKRLACYQVKKRSRQTDTGSNSSSQGTGESWKTESNGAATNNPLSTNSRLIHPSIASDPCIYPQD